MSKNTQIDLLNGGGSPDARLGCAQSEEGHRTMAQDDAHVANGQPRTSPDLDDKAGRHCLNQLALGQCQYDGCGR